jgi:hypothetical protein
MKMNKNIIKLTFACALAAGLTSCYKDDFSHCPPGTGNVKLTLHLDEQVITRTATGMDRFDITGVRVWAFGTSHRVVAHVAVGRQPDGVYDISMNLPVDEYDFVVWTGNGSVYQLVSEADELEAMELHLAHEGDVLAENIPDLLHGMARRCAVMDGNDNRVEIAMHPDTYNINVTATGMVGSGEKWEVEIADNNTHYSFDNAIVSGTHSIRYLRQGVLNGTGKFTAPLKTLAINADRHPQLILRNATTGEVRYQASLTRTIIDTYAANGESADFDRVFTYNIDMNFAPAPAGDGKMDVSITINGWQANPETSGLE